MAFEAFRKFMNEFGNPQDKLQFVHVAGTNGKGSTTAMLASILIFASYRTGLFTSPHLLKQNERIKINGVDISDEDYARLEKLVKGKKRELNAELVGFDEYTAIAFLYFAEQKVDIVVLETGLGGRLDATNIIKNPLLSIITTIDLDHTEVLGNSISAIASEKAGIIKAECPVLVQMQSPEAMEVIENKAKEMGSELYFTEPQSEKLISKNLESQIVDYKGYKGVELALSGTYQPENLMLALDGAEILKTRGFNISENALRTALKTVRWPGRFEVLRKEPVIIVDGAHNPNGVRALIQSLKDYFPGRKFHFVMGVLADKDYMDMMHLAAPLAEKFSLITPHTERALNASKMKNLIEEHYALPVIAYDSVSSGVHAAAAGQKKDEIVVVFGSLYQVGEVRNCFNS